jgi:sortase A
MRWARILGAVGRVLITAGVLILLFVAYQLWGTGLQEAKSQDELENQFDKALAEADATTTTADPGGSTPTAPPAAPVGDAVAHIVIPAIGVDKIVVQGVTVADLRRGPGHYPDSPLPGQPGNAAIAGHRTTYGAPFNRVDELEHGDEILVTTQQGSFRYTVDHTDVVRPSQVEVLDDAGDNRLTLTSCNPKYSAKQRIVVVAKLAKDAEPAPPQATTTTTPGDKGDKGDSTDSIGLDAGLSGSSNSWWPAIFWGALCALIWLLSWLAAKRLPRNGWMAYLVGAPLFFAVLFICYTHIERALPANL